MSKKGKKNYEDDHEPEIVFCRAITCRSNLGKGKCSIVANWPNGDDKISLNENACCENFFKKE